MRSSEVAYFAKPVNQNRMTLLSLDGCFREITDLCSPGGVSVRWMSKTLIVFRNAFAVNNL
jgi:hypothetical protein